MPCAWLMSHDSAADLSICAAGNDDCEAKPACSMPTVKLFDDWPLRPHRTPLFRLQL
jgi:hypothetical protein